MLFQADSFVKSFGRNVVLRAASVWATEGRITVLMGRNGCGKSTLIRCSLGLLRSRTGIVRFAGTTFVRPRLWRLAAEGVFYLPDRSLLSGRLRFRRHIELLRSKFAMDGADEIANRLEIDHLFDALPHQMSGGEQRRAELALAICRRPRCLIADEPIAEVEPKDRAIVADMLRSLARSGTAVLVTGHEVHDLLDLADDVVWMTAGTTHHLGSPERARAHDQFRREYLGPRV